MNGNEWECGTGIFSRNITTTSVTSQQLNGRCTLVMAHKSLSNSQHPFSMPLWGQNLSLRTQGAELFTQTRLWKIIWHRLWHIILKRTRCSDKSFFLFASVWRFCQGFNLGSGQCVCVCVCLPVSSGEPWPVPRSSCTAEACISFLLSGYLAKHDY